MPTTIWICLVEGLVPGDQRIRAWTPDADRAEAFRKEGLEMQEFSAVAQASAGRGVTDTMCEAAVRADHISRIQGFTYSTQHVIRDLYKPYDEQKIWAVDKNDADAEDKFHHQCRIERMRKVLEAALSVPSADRS